MKISEFIIESIDANWALVIKNPKISENPVTFYKSSKNSPPFSPGRGNVWFRKIDNEWEEYGDHGRYDYSDILKKRLNHEF